VEEGAKLAWLRVITGFCASGVPSGVFFAAGYCERGGGKQHNNFSVCQHGFGLLLYKLRVTTHSNVLQHRWF
jgi:hypothetical protein